jgi:CRISPR-associated protein Csx10
MKALSIRVTAEAPLAIRADHAPDGAKNAGYIPGPTLVGSLAAAYRLLNPDKKTEFERLFLREQVFYPGLYPAIFKDPIKPGPNEKWYRAMQAANLPVYPLPKTAQSCKRHEGFRYPEDDEVKTHGVHDTLIDWAIAKLGQEQGSKNPLSALLEHKLCPWPNKDWSPDNRKDEPCGEVMDHYTGYYRRDKADQHYMLTAKPNMRLRTHTGIDRETGTVEEGILYNREVFEEGMRFWGSIHFQEDDEELIPLFQGFIKEIGDTGLVRIGTGRTRGMGRVTLRVDSLPDEQSRFSAFKERLKTLNEELHKQAAVFELKALGNKFYFALTLHSPLILCDDLLRYRGTIDQDVLQELLGPGFQIPGLKRIYQAASVSRVTGWQEMWGLPRTNEYAIDTGSVFLFECTTPLDENVQERLFQLEEQGIGKRRSEGFGRICISDQFHQEVELR